MTEQQDAIKILEQDHREADQMFEELEAFRGASNEEERKRRKELTDLATGRGTDD